MKINEENMGCIVPCPSCGENVMIELIKNEPVDSFMGDKDYKGYIWSNDVKCEKCGENLITYLSVIVPKRKKSIQVIKVPDDMTFEDVLNFLKAGDEED